MTQTLLVKFYLVISSILKQAVLNQLYLTTNRNNYLGVVRVNSIFLYLTHAPLVVLVTVVMYLFQANFLFFDAFPDPLCLTSLVIDHRFVPKSKFLILRDLLTTDATSKPKHLLQLFLTFKNTFKVTMLIFTYSCKISRYSWQILI